MSSAATAKRFGRRVPVISATSSGASWAPSRRAGRRRSAVTSSSAMIAAPHASPTTPAATAIVPSVRGWRAPNGSRIDRPNCCRCRTSTSSSPCRRWPARSPSRTRPPSMRSCSALPLRRSPPSPPIPSIWARKSASPRCSIPGVRPCSTIRTSIAWCQAAAPRSTARAGSLAAPASSCRCACSRGCSVDCSCRTCRMHSTPASCASSATLAGLAEPTAFATALDQLRRIEWVVYAKPPFGGPEQVLAYLGRYTHRVAIANSRLVSLSDGKVRFAWKDYRANGKTKVMTLDADEFIRRFLLHALPDGFHRIRYYGFLANGHRGDNLALCRRLLDAHDTVPIPSWRPITPKAIDRTTPPTSPSAPIAAAPCGGSQPCRAPPPISRSTVTRHDPIAAMIVIAAELAAQPVASQLLSRSSCRQMTHPDLVRNRRLLAPSAPTARPPCQTIASLDAAVQPSVSPARRRHYPHSAKTTAASFNPASMRSRSRQSSRRLRATRPHRTLKIPKSDFQ